MPRWGQGRGTGSRTDLERVYRRTLFTTKVDAPWRLHVLARDGPLDPLPSRIRCQFIYSQDFVWTCNCPEARYLRNVHSARSRCWIRSFCPPQRPRWRQNPTQGASHCDSFTRGRRWDVSDSHQIRQRGPRLAHQRLDGKASASARERHVLRAHVRSVPTHRGGRLPQVEAPVRGGGKDACKGGRGQGQQGARTSSRIGD